MGKSKNKRLAKKKADRAFSLYIRQRDKGKPCITCGEYKEHDAGHFITRNHEATRYHEQNVHGQCLACNRFQGGKQYEHGLAINRRYGKGTAQKLLELSKTLCKRTKQDYEDIAQTYKDKIQ
jgi:hypothetical protein